MRSKRAFVMLLTAALAVATVSATMPAARGATENPPPLCVLDPETGECLPDRDRDGRVDSADNCADVYNPGQEDNDGDGIGNACDPAPDGDPPPPPPGGGGGGSSGGGCTSSTPVVLYEHVDFTGRCWGFGPGSYGDIGAANDVVSSIRVAAGYVATLFRSPNLDANGPWVNTETTSTYDPWGAVGNDAVSSLVVQAAPPDAAYYDGSSVDDDWPSASSTSTTTPTTCALVGDGVKHERPGRVHWRFSLRLRFCWNGAKVTTVWDQLRDVRIEPLPFPFSLVQWWRYQVLENVTAVAGYTTAIAYSRAAFEFCTWKHACLARREPWVRITLRADGSTMCETSVRPAGHRCYRASA